MKENEISVLEQYDIDIKSTRRIRGAVLCEAQQGLFVLKEMEISEKRLPMLYKLYTHLKNMGCDKVDTLLKNKEEGLFGISEDGVQYVVKRWYDGRECEVRREDEIIAATRNLANIHKVFQEPIDFGEGAQALIIEGEDTQQEYSRHNRELKKVRTFIRKKVGKGEFELAFLKHFDQMYEWAESARSRLQESQYDVLLRESREKKTITHGEYNYHNILMQEDGVATTNFEHFHQDVQLVDFYYFLRKTLEKNRWSTSLGDKMLNVYSTFLPLGEREMEYLAICLSYPEKFWKVADSYYRSSKTWISMKSVEKLEMAIRQTEEKKHFLETIFSFHL